jgi:hypothetical protein
MRFFSLLLSLGAVFFSSVVGKKRCQNVGLDLDVVGDVDVQGSLISSNSCIQFSVTSGTGCAWMCNYCASQLGTNNYYFTDNVCTYQQGQGCVGNPIAGKSYSCCSV